MESEAAHGAEVSAAGSRGKIFLGGLSWETTEDKLKNHFDKYGTIKEVVVMRDRITGKPRGFGFITFDTEEAAEVACKDTHALDGRTIDAKPSVPQDSQSRPRSKKIFVGGLAPETTPEQFKLYFERFGKVLEAQIMVDHSSSRSRGFGFVTFDEESSVHKVFGAGPMHVLAGKQVEVKSATPKGSGPQGRGAPAGVIPGAMPFGQGAAGAAAVMGAMGAAAAAAAAQGVGMVPPGYAAGAIGFGHGGYMAPGYMMPGYGGFMPYPAAYPGMMMGGGYPFPGYPPGAYHPAMFQGQAAVKGAMVQQQPAAQQASQQASQQAAQQAGQQAGQKQQQQQQRSAAAGGRAGSGASGRGGAGDGGAGGSSRGGGRSGEAAGGRKQVVLPSAQSLDATMLPAHIRPLQQQEKEQPAQQPPSEEAP